MAQPNPKHPNLTPSNAQLKSALSLIAAEIARGPLRSSSLSKIMRDTFGGSDASGIWNWRMAYDMMQAAAVQTLFLVCAVYVPLIWCLPSIFSLLDMFSIGAVGGCYGGWKWTCGSAGDC